MGYFSALNWVQRYAGSNRIFLAAATTAHHHHGWVHQMVIWMQFIQSQGCWGWALFAGLYAFCCLCFIPASLLAVGAGAVFGFWLGVLLVLVGNGIGSLLSLLIARFLLHDWLKRKIESHPRLKAVQVAVEKEDWKLVLLTRLSPIMPFSLINYALGLTNISASRFFFATEAGAVPSIVVYVYAGTVIGNLARIGPDLRHYPSLQWLIEGGGIILVIGTTFYISHLATKAIREKSLN